jgi:hypothetical protein
MNKPIPIEQIPNNGFVIEFPDLSPTEAGKNAASLYEVLKNELVDPEKKLKLERVDPAAQDLGTVIAIILGAKATIELARGVGKWLARNNQTRIRFRTRDGRVVHLNNLESNDVAGILKTLL